MPQTKPESFAASSLRSRRHASIATKIARPTASGPAGSHGRSSAPSDAPITLPAMRWIAHPELQGLTLAVLHGDRLLLVVDPDHVDHGHDLAHGDAARLLARLRALHRARLGAAHHRLAILLQLEGERLDVLDGDLVADL